MLNFCSDLKNVVDQQGKIVADFSIFRFYLAKLNSADYIWDLRVEGAPLFSGTSGTIASARLSGNSLSLDK